MDRTIRLAISAISALFVLALCAGPSAGECGLAHPFNVSIEKSSHKDDVEVPGSGCRTSQGHCRASGTVFVVTSKKIKYTVFLPDGTDADIQVGEAYSAVVTCGKQPMMVVKGLSGQAKASFFILEQETRTHVG